MGNLKILGVPDIASAASATFTAASEASSSMADDNLRTEEPSEFWRSESNKPTHTSFVCSFAKKNAFVANGVGIVGHNLGSDTGRMRVILADEGIVEGDIWEDVAVDTIEDSSNTSVSATDIDEVFFVDLNNGTPDTPGLPWSVELGFVTPTGTPRDPAESESLSNMQMFWVYVLASAAPDSPASAPTVTCSLNYNGLTIGSLGTKAVTSTTGQWLYFPWAYNSNLYPSKANIRCKLEFTDGLADEDVHLGSAVWRMEKDSFATDTGVVSDTGWFLASHVADNPYATQSYISEESPGFLSNLVDFGAEQTGLIAVHCYFAEDHSPDLEQVDRATVYQSTAGIDSTNYVEVGKFCLGIIFSPEVNFSYGDFFGSIDLSSQNYTDGGQEFGSRRAVKRTARLPLDLLTPAEAQFIYDRIIRRKGVLSPFLVSLIPDDETEASATTFYATLRNVETVMGANPAQGYERSLILELEEKC